MKQLLCMVAGLVIVALVGYVSVETRDPEALIIGTWRIDIDATKARHEYRGKSTRYLDEWRGRDADTLIRIDENTMHFWDQDWPYRVVSVKVGSVVIEMNNAQEGLEQEAKFIVEDDRIVFVFTRDSPYVLERVPD